MSAVYLSASLILLTFGRASALEKKYRTSLRLTRRSISLARPTGLRSAPQTDAIARHPAGSIVYYSKASCVRIECEVRVAWNKEQVIKFQTKDKIRNFDGLFYGPTVHCWREADLIQYLNSKKQIFTA